MAPASNKRIERTSRASRSRAGEQRAVVVLLDGAGHGDEASLEVEVGPVDGSEDVLFLSGTLVYLGRATEDGRTAAHGRGFATQAVHLILRRTFEVPDIACVCAETAVDNPASRRVVEKEGFSHVGRRDTVDDGAVDRWKLVCRLAVGRCRVHETHALTLDGIDLRDATSRDAAALAALNVASWRAAYAHMLPEAFLASLDVAAWEQRLRARFADAAQFTVVARAGRRRLGFVTAGPIRDEPPAKGGEVYALYVDPVRCGRGVGSVLLEAAVARLAGSGFSHASLWVFTRNTNARRFYERRGWRLEPRYWFWQRHGLRRQLVCYSRPLAPE